MTVNTYIYIGYGLIVDKSDTGFLENLASSYPEAEGKKFRKVCKDFDNAHWDSDGSYAFAVGKKYPTLQIRAVDETAYGENKNKLVVVATASIEELWNKYDERSKNLVFDTDQGEVPKAVQEDFEYFKSDFGLEAKKTHPVIWYEYH